MLNGKELSEYSDKERRSMVGWQGHDPELLADSVRNNVALGEEQIDVGRELSRVCLDREVSEMENGIDTLVGSRGVRLSGGQQRRTALLRALLCQPVQTLLLDEPFTGMDPELVSHAAAAVVRLAARRDTVLVTHDEHAADLLGWPVVRLEKVGK